MGILRILILQIMRWLRFVRCFGVFCSSIQALFSLIIRIWVALLHPSSFGMGLIVVVKISVLGYLAILMNFVVINLLLIILLYRMPPFSGGFPSLVWRGINRINRTASPDGFPHLGETLPPIGLRVFPIWGKPVTGIG